LLPLLSPQLKQSLGSFQKNSKPNKLNYSSALKDNYKESYKLFWSRIIPVVFLAPDFQLSGVTTLPNFFWPKRKEILYVIKVFKVLYSVYIILKGLYLLLLSFHLIYGAVFY